MPPALGAFNGNDCRFAIGKALGVQNMQNCWQLPHNFPRNDMFWEFLTNARAYAEKARGSKTLIRYLQLMLSASNNDYIHCNT
jgi:hypothetical protein